jgi:pyruvate dehydrogenase E1 component beta subunit
MSVEILMPALSPTMEEGTLSKWLVKEGDTVTSGDLIAEIETDKATMEVETIEDGIIGKLVVSEGEESIKVNSVIAILINNGEELPIIETLKDELVLPDKMISDNIEIDTQLIKNNNATSSSKITVREALRNAMSEEMRLDDNVFIMGE